MSISDTGHALLAQMERPRLEVFLWQWHVANIMSPAVLWETVCLGKALPQCTILTRDKVSRAVSIACLYGESSSAAVMDPPGHRPGVCT